MKRLFCLLLCAVLLLGLLAGCSGGEETQSGDEDMAAAFSVGYGKADISPEESVYLIGHNEPKEERMSTAVAESLYVTCVAFTDEENETVLFLATDLLYVRKEQSDQIREAISKDTAVPFDHVILHCSHNHSGPDASDLVYFQLLKERCQSAAKDAMGDRAPAQMFTAFSRPEGYNFVRHYLLTDGTYMGEAVGAVEKDMLVGHTHKCDNLLQLVKFSREGKKDIVMMNWRGHPWGTEPVSHTTATPNYPGVMRQVAEEGLDCLGVFVLGASGNSNNGTQIPEEDRFGKRYQELGKALGQEVIKTAENFIPAKTDKIQFEENIYLGDSVYGSDFEVPLYVFSVGDVAFTTAPFETFDTNEVYVRENSKFKMTVHASVTNDWQSYLPTPESFSWEYRYEVRVTQYPQGMAETVADQLLEMLNRIFEAGGYQEEEKTDGYITPEFIPYTDGVEYMIVGAGSTNAYCAVENGFYQINVLADGKVKQKLVRNEETAKIIIQKDYAKFLFNEQGVIVDIAD